MGNYGINNTYENQNIHKKRKIEKELKLKNKLFKNLFTKELSATCSFESLPKVILYKIFGYLDLKEYLLVSSLNKFFFNLYFNQELKYSDLIWNRFYLEDMGEIDENEIGKDPFNVELSEYEKRFGRVYLHYKYNNPFKTYNEAITFKRIGKKFLVKVLDNLQNLDDRYILTKEINPRGVRGFKLKVTHISVTDKYFGFGALEEGFEKKGFLCKENVRGKVIDIRFGNISGYGEGEFGVKNTDWGRCSDCSHVFIFKIDFNRKLFVCSLNGIKEKEIPFVKKDQTSYVFVIDPYHSLTQFEIEFFIE